MPGNVTPLKLSSDTDCGRSVWRASTHPLHPQVSRSDRPTIRMAAPAITGRAVERS